MTTSQPPSAIRLEVFKHLFASIAEEMGVVLRKASYSPNIKERRDFSCALFDAQAQMISQAAHIPVHLGSMPLSVQAAIRAVPTLEPGDIIILNDPYRGGTHLPDITLVSPVFMEETTADDRPPTAEEMTGRKGDGERGRWGDGETVDDSSRALGFRASTRGQKKNLGTATDREQEAREQGREGAGQRLTLGIKGEEIEESLLSSSSSLISETVPPSPHLPVSVSPRLPVSQAGGGPRSVVGGRLFGFVASRAHHADVGGMAAGSMPVAREIYQEGLIIPPVKLFSHGKLNQEVFDLILANVRTPQERAGDLWAQIAANQRGVTRLQELVGKYGQAEVAAYMGHLLDYTERMTRRLLEALPDGTYRFTDYLDEDGIEKQPIPITASVTIQGDQATVDFTGSAPQQKGSVNAVYAITLSAVFYVFRCLLGLDVPNNAGCLKPIRVIAPAGSVVNALPPAPVAGGNVETSQRIVDVLLGALSQADPQRIPAASQGTMNNLIIGGWDPDRNAPFTYYETIGGGMGARPTASGPSAIHSHMTNTLNTPVEALEYSYPLRVVRYSIRRGSGGQGKFQGGDGICREIQVLVDAQVSLISERRKLAPYGLQGGKPGQTGENLLIRNGIKKPLPGKGTFYVQKGDIISIQTPGGGGYGK